MDAGIGRVVEAIEHASHFDRGRFDEAAAQVNRLRVSRRRDTLSFESKGSFSDPAVFISMDSVLASLGALLLRALPTFLIVLLLHFYLKWVFYRPLDQALSARRQATAGARQQAEESLRKAEKKTAQYEEALRAARTEIYREQEVQRRQLREEQARAVAEARGRLEQTIARARQSIEAGKHEALASLGAQSEALAEQIASAVLRGESR